MMTQKSLQVCGSQVRGPVFRYAAGSGWSLHLGAGSILSAENSAPSTPLQCPRLWPSLHSSEQMRKQREGLHSFIHKQQPTWTTKLLAWGARFDNSFNTTKLAIWGEAWVEWLSLKGKKWQEKRRKSEVAVRAVRSRVIIKLSAAVLTDWRAITELLSKSKHAASQPSYTAWAWTVTRGNLTLPVTESLQAP